MEKRKTFFLFMICVVTLMAERNKKVAKIRENVEKEKLIYKQEEVIRTYNKWMDHFREKKTIESFLLNNQFNTVAVYGIGRLGKQLYHELINSKVCVSYIIDQKAQLDRTYDRVRCYSPDENLPEVDMIIVTVPGEDNFIISQLKKGNKCQVRSIKEILFVL